MLCTKLDEIICRSFIRSVSGSAGKLIGIKLLLRLWIKTLGPFCLGTVNYMVIFDGTGMQPETAKGIDGGVTDNKPGLLGTSRDISAVFLRLFWNNRPDNLFAAVCCWLVLLPVCCCPQY